MVEEDRSKKPDNKGKKGVAVLLTPLETKGMLPEGATYFKHKDFQKATKDLPPHTPLAKILKGLKRKK
jgi:hypothetical protein